MGTFDSTSRSSDTNDSEHEIHRGAVAGKGREGKGKGDRRPTEKLIRTQRWANVQYPPDDANRKGNRGRHSGEGLRTKTNNIEPKSARRGGFSCSVPAALAFPPNNR